MAPTSLAGTFNPTIIPLPAADHRHQSQSCRRAGSTHRQLPPRAASCQRTGRPTGSVGPLVQQAFRRRRLQNRPYHTSPLGMPFSPSCAPGFRQAANADAMARATSMAAAVVPSALPDPSSSYRYLLLRTPIRTAQAPTATTPRNGRTPTFGMTTSPISARLLMCRPAKPSGGHRKHKMRDQSDSPKHTDAVNPVAIWVLRVSDGPTGRPDVIRIACTANAPKPASPQRSVATRLTLPGLAP